MRSFRSIVVNNAKFRWRFRYDDYDYCFPSYLLFLPEGNPKAEIRVVFRGKQEKFWLNVGLSAIKDGEIFQINLNQPRYSAEILRFCLQQVDFSEKLRWELDGDAALRVLGYQTFLDAKQGE